jgi:hypothetical protein
VNVVNHHQEYGPYDITKKYDVHWFCRKTGKIERFPGYHIEVFDKTSDLFVVVNSKTGRIMKPSRIGKVKLCNNLYQPTISVVNIILSSVFPNLDPVTLVRIANPNDRVLEPTIDHIDSNFKDNRVQNLRWMTWSNNARLGQIQSVKRINEKGGRNGKFVEIYKASETTLLIARVRSYGSAARLIMQIRDPSDEYNANEKTTSTKIGEVCRGKRSSAFGFVFKNVVIPVDSGSDDDEEWIACYVNPEYLVSNKGRVRGKIGILTQNKDRSGSKYSSVNIAGKHVFVHILVWYSFNRSNANATPMRASDSDSDSPYMVICHFPKDGDSVPIVTPDGVYRNWLQDLRYDSHSQNMREWHSSEKNNLPTDGISIVAQATCVDEIRPSVVNIVNQATETYNRMNPLERLMAAPPQYVQYWKASGGSGSKYVLNKLSGLCEKDLKSVSSVKVSDKVKFLQTLYRMGHSDYQGLIQYLNDDERKVLFTIISKSGKPSTVK